jgi:hypothetical protein
LEQIIDFGKRKIGFLGLSFKEGTDDLRNSPIVDILEKLLGKGFEIRIYDKSVSLAKLVGGNKDYILKRIPFISRFLADDESEVVSRSEVIVVVNKEAVSRNPGQSRPGQDYFRSCQHRFPRAKGKWELPRCVMVKRKHILFIVENNSVPYDRRVWNEALSAREFGYDVSIICPSDRRYRRNRETIKGIRIYRHPCPLEGWGKMAFVFEYLNAFCWESLLSMRIFLTHPFSIIHSANPPDHIFLIALAFRPAGVKFVFDHHDLTPETYIAKYGARGTVYRILLWMERLALCAADIVISTNESYKKVAIKRC